MNLDDLRADFLDLVRRYSELETQLRTEIAEYRKTVNTALGLLSKEIIEQTERQMAFIARDVTERKARQRRQDYKDLALGAIGCLIVAFGCILIGLLAWRIWQI